MSPTSPNDARRPVADKRERLYEPHVAPLNTLVEAWRREKATTRIPWFDPDDGGVNARVMILMEAPAPRTVSATGTGICSEDNADSTNRRLSALREAAGVARAQCVKWNMVPWAVNEDARPVRTPSRPETDSAIPHLLELLRLLREVEVVVALGNVASSGFLRATTAPGVPNTYRVVSAPHPSQRNAHGRADALDRIARAFSLVADHLGGRTSGP